MAWFAKRTPKPHGNDRIAWMTATAQRLFAERGIETTISHGDTDLDVTLIAIDGQRYFLRNLLAATRDASPREAEQMARAHVESLAADATGHDVSRLSAEEVRQRIRTRLLSNRDLRPDEPRFDYARPFADGLVVALCIDLPHTVQTLGDSAVADLALDIDELYEQGQRNTDLEPIDEHDTLPGGVQIFAGASLFIASKAVHLPAVIAAPPQGIVFAVPHRNMLLAVPLTDADAITGVQHLVGITERVLGDAVPGGPVSSDLFFARDGRVSRITETDAAGTPHIVVEGDFHQALEELVARDDGALS
ncbi:MAG: hypothetical protein PIR02_03400 [Microbacterium enclense]